MVLELNIAKLFSGKFKQIQWKSAKQTNKFSRKHNFQQGIKIINMEKMFKPNSNIIHDDAFIY